MKVYGLDFTSAPSRRKPLVALRCKLEDEALRVEDADTLTSFEKWFEGQALGADDSLRTIIHSHRKDPDEVISLANSPDTRAQYDRETDAARQLGGFGSPTFAVGQEIFWGDDRLEEALAWAKDQHPALTADSGSRQALA